MWEPITGGKRALLLFPSAQTKSQDDVHQTSAKRLDELGEPLPTRQRLLGISIFLRRTNQTQ
eukprot:9180337-Pyramimonas_sp.AAC.1